MKNYKDYSVPYKKVKYSNDVGSKLFDISDLFILLLGILIGFIIGVIV